MSLTTDMTAMLAGLLDAETITYTPSGGSPRAIQAAVLRAEPQPDFVGAGEVPAVRYQLTVAHDAVAGVATPKPGKDVFSLKVHVSDANPATFRLSRVIHEDSGSYTLEVVK